MKTFSVFNYENLSDEQKGAFNRALAQRLIPYLQELKKDDVIGSLDVEGVVTSNCEITKSSLMVMELYHKISSGIQVGSGNQILFNRVLADYAKCWASMTE